MSGSCVWLSGSDCFSVGAPEAAARAKTRRNEGPTQHVPDGNCWATTKAKAPFGASAMLSAVEELVGNGDPGIGVRAPVFGSIRRASINPEFLPVLKF